jgi:peptidoglycan/LPS O-acetylase OafA/YrhL
VFRNHFRRIVHGWRVPWMMGSSFSRSSREGPLARWLSAHAFAVYVLHPPVPVALTPCLRPLKVDVLTNTLLLAVVGLAATWAVADIARRPPSLRVIL